MPSLHSLLRKYSYGPIYLSLGKLAAVGLLLSFLFFPTVQIYRCELGPRGPCVLTMRIEIGYVIPYAKYDSSIYFSREEDRLSRGRFTEYISSTDEFGITKVVWGGLIVRCAILAAIFISLRYVRITGVTAKTAKL